MVIEDRCRMVQILTDYGMVFFIQPQNSEQVYCLGPVPGEGHVIVWKIGPGKDPIFQEMEMKK